MIQLMTGFVMVFLCSGLGAQAQMDKPINKKKVFINQIVKHPALENTVSGIIDGLAQNGYRNGDQVEVRVESAQGNAALSSQIASKFVAKNPDVVVGVGTVSAQGFMPYVRKGEANLVFSSVTDPEQSGLVTKRRDRRYSVSGVSNFVAIEPQLALFRQIQPELQKIGVLYNPGEANSLSMLSSLRKACQAKGITLVPQGANKTADMPQAAMKLASAVDALFITNDNTALAALPSIIAVANKRQIPVYVSDTDAVVQGALAALGPNQYQVGVQTGAMIASVLDGASLNAIPVEYPAKTELFVNVSAAKKLGIAFPEAVLSQATLVGG